MNTVMKNVLVKVPGMPQGRFPAMGCVKVFCGAAATVAPL